MAIARLSVKVGKVGRAHLHAAYIARVGPYEGRLERGERLEASVAGNMPAWAAHDPQRFWQAADQHERSNGTTYREFEIALPRELDSEARVALVSSFVAQELGDRHAYQWAIHVPKALDGGEQPHAHVMFSERQVDGIERDPGQYFKRYNAKAPELGGAKKGWGERAGESLSHSERVAELKALRTRWEVACNAALERAGETARIDMRSHRDAGVEREPERKMLPSEWRQAEVRAEVAEVRSARDEHALNLRKLKEEIPDLPAYVSDLELARHKRTYGEWLSSLKAEVVGKSVAELRDLRAQKGPARSVAEIIEGLESVRSRREQHQAAAEAKGRGSDALDRSWQSIARIDREAAQWRKEHWIRALAHDSGVRGSKELKGWAVARAGHEVDAGEQAKRLAELTRAEADAAAKLEAIRRHPRIVASAEVFADYQKKREALIASAIESRTAHEREAKKLFESLNAAAKLHVAGKLKVEDPKFAELLGQMAQAQRLPYAKRVEQDAPRLKSLADSPNLRAEMADRLKPHEAAIKQVRDRGFGR